MKSYLKERCEVGSIESTSIKFTKGFIALFLWLIIASLKFVQVNIIWITSILMEVY